MAAGDAAHSKHTGGLKPETLLTAQLLSQTGFVCSRFESRYLVSMKQSKACYINRRSAPRARLKSKPIRNKFQMCVVSLHSPFNVTRWNHSSCYPSISFCVKSHWRFSSAFSAQAAVSSSKSTSELAISGKWSRNAGSAIHAWPLSCWANWLFGWGRRMENEKSAFRI